MSGFRRVRGASLGATAATAAITAISAIIAITAVALVPASPAQAASGDPNVWFIQPTYGDSVYGPVEIEIDAYTPPGEELLSVELFIEGRSIGILTQR